MNLERYRIIDVRERDEFERDGHLPGAELMPLSTLAATAAELERDEPLLVVCRSGRRSARACELLDELGFQRVDNLEGGVIGWAERGLPLCAGAHRQGRCAAPARQAC
jgi:rhodanese-related sulfurtransferase